jgi:hypothetical protein
VFKDNTDNRYKYRISKRGVTTTAPLP